MTWSLLCIMYYVVTGEHLLLFITRTEHWFFLRPFPAAPLFRTILVTQILAILMCALGWLVESISWHLIAWICAYSLAWMFLSGPIRLITVRFVDFRTGRHIKSLDVVNQSLRTHG